jgi:electron transfer flavoprotein alpha subunit
MNPPLVFIELRDQVPTPGSLGLLAEARGLGGSAAALVCGTSAATVATTLGAFGADDIRACDAPVFDAESPGPYVDAVAGLIDEEGPRAVLFENSVLAASVAAGLSARLDAGVNWDLQGVFLREGRLVGTRLALNDTVAVDVSWMGEVQLAVFRVGAHEVVACTGRGLVRSLAPTFASQSLAVKLVDRATDDPTDDTSLSTAKVVIAGGRGVRDRDSLGLLEDLAHALGGVVGVSLPLVDSGWYPRARQVGMTGQFVQPDLYVACGISGALAHRIGMEKSGTIVAINSDPAAPIFSICDAGVVGDLHEVIPQLTRLVQHATSHEGPSGPR